MKTTFDRILHELQYLDREHPHHPHWIWSSWIGYSSIDLLRVEATPFQYRPSIELQYMFDTLGFLWLHYYSPQYMIYHLEKLADGLADERMKPPRSTTTTTL